MIVEKENDTKGRRDLLIELSEVVGSIVLVLELSDSLARVGIGARRRLGDLEMKEDGEKKKGEILDSNTQVHCSECE